MKKIKMKKQHRKEISYALSLITQIGLNIIVTIGLSLFIGKSLDDWLGTSPLFLLIFIVMGVGAAFKVLFKLTMKDWEE